MKSINNPRAKALPFYGKPSFRNSLKTSSRIRKTNSVKYLWNRIVNRLLLFFAFHCPVNSWRLQFHRWRKVYIGEGVFIGMHIIIDRAYPEYVRIEDNAMLAGGNHLLAHSRAPEYFKGKLLSYVAPIVIKEYAWLGINSIVLPGVTIGKGAVVTAGSVVTEDVPDNTIVRGNPAVVVRTFEK
ncbi:MAG: acyltransferase [Lentimicrobium sp.]